MDRIKLGVIVNIRGLKGEVKIQSSSSFGSIRYSKGNKIILVKDNKEIILTVLSYSSSSSFDFVLFEEIDSIEKANELRGYEVYIDKSYLHSLNNNEYYYYQLLQLDVFDTSNNYLGKVIEVIDNPANTILRIKDKKEILVPFVKAFINSVDIDNKKIIINYMEGL